MSKKTFVLLFVLLAAIVGLQAQTVLTEGFNDAVPPATWTSEVVADGSGSGSAPEISMVTSGTYPTSAPTEGSAMLKFNSFNSHADSEIRLATPQLDLTGYSVPAVEFDIMHYLSSYSVKDDKVQVQVATDGTTWNNVGDEITCYRSSTEGGTGWETVKVDISDYANQNVYVGLLFHSDYGYNIFIDDLSVFNDLLPRPATNPSPADEAVDVAANAVLSWTLGINTSSQDVYLSTDRSLVEAGDASVMVLTGTTASSYAANLELTSVYFWKVVAHNVGEEASSPVWSFSTVIANITSYPYEVNFDAFPPAGWSVDSGSEPWAQYTTGGVTYAYAHYWGWDNSDTSYMNMPTFELPANPVLTFNWSHKFASYYDEDALYVQVSTDEGDTWTNVWSKVGTEFESNDGAGNTTPGDMSNLAIVNLGAYASQTVDIRIFGDSDAGPDVFIDNFIVKDYPNTPPAVAALFPEDQAEGIALADTLKWEETGYANGYKLYLGTNQDADNLIDGQDLGNVTQYVYSDLNLATTYYWKVAPYNAVGENTDVATSSFTTLAVPYPVGLVSPAMGAQAVDISGTLTWEASDVATGYKLYLGTDAEATSVVNGTDLGNVTSYSYSELNVSTAYYWKVVPYNTHGDAIDCPVWRFTTSNGLALINYGYYVSSINEVDMSAAETVHASGDDFVVALTWPFDFDIYNVTYQAGDTLYFSSNGFLRFDAEPQTTAYYYDIPTDNDRYGQFLSFGGDNDGQATGAVKTLVHDGKFIILCPFTTYEYHGYYDDTYGYEADVQITFDSNDGSITMAYIDTFQYGYYTENGDDLGINYGDGVTGTNIGEFPEDDIAYTIVYDNTIPIMPSEPTPASGSDDQPLSLTLSWTEGHNTTGQNVYFGSDQSLVDTNDASTLIAANTNDTSVFVEHLLAGTTYYWRVEALGTVSVNGPVWSFETVPPPNSTTLATPSNNSTNRPAYGTLWWNSVSAAEGYYLNFGSDNPPTNLYNNVNMGTDRYFEYSDLEAGRDYYWQVVPYNSAGSAVDCPVWKFTVSEENPNYGSDAAGTYYFANSTQAASSAPSQPTYNWVDTTGHTLLDASNITQGSWSTDSADDVAWTLDLPFDFRFYGSAYSTVYANSNGLLSFETSDAYSNVTIPNSSTPNNFIAAMWDDFKYVDFTTMYFGGNDDMVTITYNNLQDRYDEMFISMQVNLFASGKIIICYNYDQSSFNFLSSDCFYYNGTIGIENSDGTDGIQYRFGNSNTSYVGGPFIDPVDRNMAVAFGPDQNDLGWSGGAPETPVNVTVSVSGGNAVISWDAVSGAGSYNVYYSTTADGTYNLLTSTGSTSYTHNSVSGNAFYYVTADSTPVPTMVAPATTRIKRSFNSHNNNK